MSEQTPSHPHSLHDESPSRSPAGSPSISGTADDRREELDDLIWKAQELARNLDSLSTASEIGDQEPSPELTREPTTIAELDQAIASSADRELQMTVAATVDAVLDQVFEERAAVVQKLDAPAAPIIDERVPKPNPTAAAEQEPSPTPLPSIAIESSRSVFEPAHLEPEPSSTIVEGAPEPAPAKATPTEVVARVTLRTASAAPVFQNATMPRGSFSFSARMEKLSQSAVPMLMILNFPLRWVPASLRPMVDWAALSLLVWVPIIWIMVLTLGNKPQTDAAQTEPIAPTTHAAQSSP